MDLKPYICQTLSFFRLHRPDCQHCADHDCQGILRQRLMELNEHARRICETSTHTKGVPPRNDAA